MDLLAENDRNTYACDACDPSHLAVAIDKFEYRLDETLSSSLVTLPFFPSTSLHFQVEPGRDSPPAPAEKNKKLKKILHVFISIVVIWGPAKSADVTRGLPAGW